MMKKINYLVLLFALTMLALVGCASGEESTNGEGDKAPEKGTTEGGLPKQLVFSVYGVGAGTYNDMAAVADVFTSEYGTQIRLLPSDTGVGRMAPLKNETADFARVGEEYIYAFEGDLDFSNKEWGPQDVRMVWGPLAPIGLAVREDSGINSPKELKGKKVPFILANPSVNNKMEAYLAYGGLTWDDVEEVKVSYSDQANAFKSGQIDAILFNVYGSPMYELESAVKFKWLNLDDQSPEVLERVAEAAPSVTIAPIKNAAGMEEGEEIFFIQYSVPVISYADKNAEEVYELVKAFDEQYDNYKDVTVSLGDSSLEDVMKKPLIVPFHEGAIKYYKEKGVWSEEDDAKNDELIHRQEQLKTLWGDFIQTAEGENLHEEWNEFKAEKLQ